MNRFMNYIFIRRIDIYLWDVQRRDHRQTTLGSIILWIWMDPIVELFLFFAKSKKKKKKKKYKKKNSWFG